MPSDLPITDAERLVMEAVWDLRRASSREISQSVRAHEDWHPKTVQTLISRLVAKGALLRDKHGRGYLYTPALPREEFIRRKSRQFVSAFFKGRITPLVAAFAESGQLTETDLSELREFVESLDDQEKGDRS